MNFLYKYFTEKSHMDSFINGTIRFSSIATYKHMENNGTISDSSEAEQFIHVPSQNIKEVTLETAPTITHQIKELITDIQFGYEVINYSHFFIFCSSHKDVSSNFKAENATYKYYVKFDLNDFNAKFDNYFNPASIINQGNDTSKRPYFIRPFNNFKYVVIFSGRYYKHKRIEYNETDIINSNCPENLLFRKNNKFQNQQEYRHTFILDYFKLEDESNIEFEINEYLCKIKSNDILTNIKDIGFIKKLAISIPITPKILDSGEI